MSSTTFLGVTSGHVAPAARRAPSTGSFATAVAHAHPAKTVPVVPKAGEAIPAARIILGAW
eukprot:4813220-Pyramimonas_sp.AAC.1